MLENSIFAKYIPDYNSLLEYGFCLLANSSYYYECEIDNGKFLLKITISKDGKVVVKVWDVDLDDEYNGFRVETNIGNFAGKIRELVSQVLIDIRDNCFFKQNFISSQANRISQIIYNEFGDVPIFEWDSSPDFGVFKNSITKKWYALIMNIDVSKFGLSSEKRDVINVKLNQNNVLKCLSQKGFYPAYHMNKKNWISIVLDDTISDDEIMNCIRESYSFSQGNKVEKVQREWIVPANPKYYDIQNYFIEGSIQHWKHSSNIQVGDIIYIYVGSPVSAILYQCEVLKCNIPYSFHENRIHITKMMEIRILKIYDNRFLPFSKLKEFHINVIRGPRGMPKVLSDYIKNERVDNNEL